MSTNSSWVPKPPSLSVPEGVKELVDSGIAILSVVLRVNLVVGLSGECTEFTRGIRVYYSG